MKSSFKAFLTACVATALMGGVATAAYASSGGTLTFTVSASPSGGSVPVGQKVSLSASPNGSGIGILYTTDGSEPDITNPSASYYLDPVTISSNLTIKAVVVDYTVDVEDDEDEVVSRVFSFSYTVTNAPPATIAPVSASPGSGTVSQGTAVSLSCATPNTEILYTVNGSDPHFYGNVYTGPITINQTTTIVAIARDRDAVYSNYSTFTYNVASTMKASEPLTNVPIGTVAQGTLVTLSSRTGGAAIYYTDDGSNPVSSNSRKTYSAPIAINSNVTIKAYAAMSGYANSEVVTLVYNVGQQSKAAQPVANVGAGTVNAGTSVTLTSTTAGASIMYTDDGSDPLNSSSRKQYTAPISITRSMTIKAVATASGFANSDVTTLAYTVGQAPQPTAGTTIIKLTIGEKRYTKNGVEGYFDVAPFINSERTMVPIRFISNDLGLNVDWKDDIKTEYITNPVDGRSLTIVLGQPLPNGLGTAMIMNDRLFVPLRYVVEGLGAKVDWDAATRTATISK